MYAVKCLKIWIPWKKQLQVDLRSNLQKNIHAMLRWYNQFIAWFFFLGNLIFVEWHLGAISVCFLYTSGGPVYIRFTKASGNAAV